MSKLEKTIARQQEKIAEGQFYEAHQQLRVIAARYAKQNNPAAQVDILARGARLLLDAGQGGSGGDLCLALLEAYAKASIAPDAEAKARVLALLRAFPRGEPTRKRFVGEMISWSAKFGPFPAGDPDLHHVAGTLYAEEDELVEAERHLVLGTQDSAEILAKLEFKWYKDDAAGTAGLYAARAVLPYLLIGNLRAANKSLLLFTSALGSGSGEPPDVVEVSSKMSDLRVYPGMPLLNFLGLLLLAAQRGSADLFRQLRSHYSKDLTKAGWDEALAQIGQMYFGIKIPTQANPLLDIMGSLFMGKGAGGSGKPAKGNASPAPPLVD